MKLSHIFLFIPLLPLLVAGCTSADDDSGATDAQNGPLTLYTVIDAPVTRASGTEWEASDRIGVTVGIGSDTSYNLPFATPSGDGVFLPTDEIEPFRVDPAISDSMTVTAYYPFMGDPGKEASTSIIQHTLSANDQKDATSRSKIDYLFASFNSQPPTTNVYLSFRHCMARVVFNFKAGDGIDGLEEITCIFNSVCKGTFNPRTGEAVATGTATDKLELIVPRGVTTAEYILFPQPANASKFTFELKMKGKTFTPDKDEIDNNFNPLQAGNTYTINVFFDNGTVIFSSVKSGGWTDMGEVKIDSTTN